MRKVRWVDSETSSKGRAQRAGRRGSYMKRKKVILIVLDSVGIGALPDAADYGDAGAHTLRHVVNACHTRIPNLMKLGLCNIEGAGFGEAQPAPIAAYARMREVSAGKDTTTGHWEIAGVKLDQPFPTFPEGFPAAFIEAFEARTGRGTIGNYPSSGTAILDQLGEEHMKTGKLIVYTSADSVFQIAAHEEIVPVDELYRYCELAREMLQGELGVGRVIARPFIGTPGAFVRTGRRRDFSMPPPRNLLDALSSAGLTVFGVGKIEDIFCHRGLTGSNHASGNPACIEATLRSMEEDYSGLLFTNLVDYDMLYGHRNDVQGYSDALEAFDQKLPEIYARMNEGDMLIITADHGCDPTHPGTDHTREHTPMLCYQKGIGKGVDLGTRATYADISATILDFFDLDNPFTGTSFLEETR